MGAMEAKGTKRESMGRKVILVMGVSSSGSAAARRFWNEGPLADVAKPEHVEHFISSRSANGAAPSSHSAASR